MFIQYDYFTAISERIPEIKTIGRVTGLMGLDEAMEKLRSNVPIMLFAEDEGDGFLSLERGNFDHGFHSFYIMDFAKLGDSSDRYRALNVCMAAALKILSEMKKDSGDFGSACYGIDWSRIDYQRIGPMFNNAWGYMFTYVLRNENFLLIPRDVR